MNGQYMGYRTTLSINPVHVPDDQIPYMYRVWRVMPDGTEVLLNKLNDVVPDNSDYLPGEDQWQTNYALLRDTYPGDQPIQLIDYFVEKAISGNEELNVNYIVRMYSELENEIVLPTRDGVGQFGLADDDEPARFNSNTPTGIYEMNMDSQVEEITYVNALGMRSSKPFDGVNIVVVKLHNGSTATYKILN